MQKIKLFILLSVSSFLLAGCGRDPGRPVDLPDLYPVSITIVQDGKPLEGANVTLDSKTPMKYGTSSEITDAVGKAVIRTYGYNGAPVGEYAVMVDKRAVEGARDRKNEFGDIEQVGGKVFQYVEGKYQKKETTPFSVSVVEDGEIDETFDVGKAVHVFMFNMP